MRTSALARSYGCRPFTFVKGKKGNQAESLGFGWRAASSHEEHLAATIWQASSTPELMRQQAGVGMQEAASNPSFERTLTGKAALAAKSRVVYHRCSRRPGLPCRSVVRSTQTLGLGAMQQAPTIAARPPSLRQEVIVSTFSILRDAKAKQLYSSCAADTLHLRRVVSRSSSMSQRVRLAPGGYR